MLKWLDTSAAERFVTELAQELMKTLSQSTGARDAKFAEKAEKALIKADLKVRTFRANERPNFYKRSKMANTFLWALKDAGCDEAYAKELTEWLTLRL